MAVLLLDGPLLALAPAEAALLVAAVGDVLAVLVYVAVVPALVCKGIIGDVICDTIGDITAKVIGKRPLMAQLKRI